MAIPQGVSNRRLLALQWQSAATPPNHLMSFMSPKKRLSHLGRWHIQLSVMSSWPMIGPSLARAYSLAEGSAQLPCGGVKGIDGDGRKDIVFGRAAS
jgi:hypothetical protein